MIYIDDNYNVWLITLIGASGKSANAPLLPNEKEIKTMIDLTEIIEDAVEQAVANRIEQATKNAVEYLDLDDKIDEEVANYIEGCEDLINDTISEKVRRYFE